MVIYLSGHYSNSFLMEIGGSKILNKMKIYLVNVSTTAGGNKRLCISVLQSNTAS